MERNSPHQRDKDWFVSFGMVVFGRYTLVLHGLGIAVHENTAREIRTRIRKIQVSESDCDIP